MVSTNHTWIQLIPSKLLDHLVSYCDSTNDEATLMQTIEFNQNDMKKNIFPLVFLWIKTVIQKQISPG